MICRLDVVNDVDTSIADRLATQKLAWKSAEDFVNRGGIEEYASRRNFVSDQLVEVSILSPAVRYRLITEYQLADFAVKTVGEKVSGKFVQEIYWRIYWKGWLEQRPSVWEDWLAALDGFTESKIEKAIAVMNGESGVAIMDYFAKRLIETGYLHNHARMWFAAFWIHHLQLPWELGAQFFLSHLLDGDPASNTLSWRWVAGLHTKGKAYQVGESNLRKYIDSNLLETYSEGLEKLQFRDIAEDELFVEHPSAIQLTEFPVHPPYIDGNIGLWIHEDDLDFASSALCNLSPKSVFIGANQKYWAMLSPSDLKTRYLKSVLTDSAKRASSHYQCPITCHDLISPFEALFREWVERYDIKSIIYLQPFIGPASSTVQNLQKTFHQIDWFPLRRFEDSQYLPMAKSGFFGYWNKVQRMF